MSVGTKPRHHKKAQKLVKEMHDNDGLAPLNIERFWSDQEIASKDPFGSDIPQCPMGINMNGRCVFDEPPVYRQSRENSRQTASE
jgi:hypothetical protein